MNFLFERLQQHFNEHGYWTVAIVLLLENAGLPVPGETVLLFAAFIAHSQGTLELQTLVPLAIGAAVVGDNLGYWFGLRGGRRFLARYQKFFRVSAAQLARAEGSFARYGPMTVFLARFVFGLRILAGPLAGVLNMPWRRFLLFNALGAVVWVSTIATVGALFGRHWDDVLRVMGRVNSGLLIAGGMLIVVLWLRYRFRRD